MGKPLTRDECDITAAALDYVGENWAEFLEWLTAHSFDYSEDEAEKFTEAAGEKLRSA